MSSNALAVGLRSPRAIADLPETDVEILDTLEKMRTWREKAFKDGLEVGFVPTMGALHNGHLSLVKQSLASNDRTIVSIFVNPAQFAPHEDLNTYPRTLSEDLMLLDSTSISLPSTSGDRSAPVIRKTSAVFLPSVRDMYPSGIAQNVADQKGAFIEVKGYSHQMEGKSRPTFFRGVATVVTKLFNAVQPTRAYFGQKDIQQALLLRRMCGDLLLSHPLPSNLHTVPTYRSSIDGLALSSRNAYLTPGGREVASVLYQSLCIGEQAWKNGGGREGAIAAAVEHIVKVKRTVEADKKHGAELPIILDYIEMNDPESFDVVDWDTKEGDGRPVVLNGALWVGHTRLIDNIILGDVEKTIISY